jgi:hypothetical protein
VTDNVSVDKNAADGGIVFPLPSSASRRCKKRELMRLQKVQANSAKNTAFTKAFVTFRVLQVSMDTLHCNFACLDEKSTAFSEPFSRNLTVIKRIMCGSVMLNFTQIG